MRHDHRVQMTVEAPGACVRLIRVCGPLDRGSAAGLSRLIDAQLELIRAGRADTADLLIDFAEVSSYEPGGLEVLRHARHSARRHGIGLHLSGWAARSHLLPLRVRQVITEFHSFPTIEIAVAALCPIDVTPPPTPVAAQPTSRATPSTKPVTEPVTEQPVTTERLDGPGALRPSHSRHAAVSAHLAGVPAQRSAPSSKGVSTPLR